ncbi:type II secretion system F family protein [Chrysiogenes arsenatis]|uniref:type II secretion system F family protein n=1 Tax=Chrysiogenes arsenatis TaxID=309797 RepID=UPI0003FA6ACB|nr:type II secretion system F family protein [Chrysiogenes arsenatis]
MPSFQYKGRDASGKPVSGVMDANNADDIASDLFAQGITPITITPAKGGGSGAQRAMKDDADSKESFWQKLNQQPISSDDILMFCRQMYALIKAGVPLMRTLHGLADASPNKSMQKVLADIANQLESGMSLSACLQSHPKIFPPITVNMVYIGENTGQLDRAFLQIAAFLEMDKTNKKRIKQATRYPTIICTAMFLALTVINVFVIPAFTSVFAKLGSDLPLATRFLIGMSGLFTNYWWAMIITVVVSVIAYRSYKRTPSGAFNVDRYSLKMPLIGKITELIILSRFCRTLAMMLSSGVPALQALSAVARSLGNLYIAQSVDDMRMSIEGGESLSRSAAATGRFSPMVLQMLAVGEETGATDTMLIETADFYDQQIEYDLKRLSDALEPILLVFMGVLVLILALGIFMPMWSMGSAMK